MIAIYITFPDKSCAETISHKLLELKLVACANIYASDSHYLWNGKVKNTTEFVAIYKTQQMHFHTIELFIIAEHPYDVPCIIYWQIESNESYKQWVIRESSLGALNIE